MIHQLWLSQKPADRTTTAAIKREARCLKVQSNKCIKSNPHSVLLENESLIERQDDKICRLVYFMSQWAHLLNKPLNLQRSSSHLVKETIRSKAANSWPDWIWWVEVENKSHLPLMTCISRPGVPRNTLMSLLSVDQFDAKWWCLMTRLTKCLLI